MNRKRKYRCWLLVFLALDLILMGWLGYRLLDRKIPDQILVDHEDSREVANLLKRPFISFDDAITVSGKDSYKLHCRLCLLYTSLAEEIRSFLIQSVSETGGHLASNLGVVELTLALHNVLDLPQDKLIWDVGHQAYTHKILTGRKDGFKDLRKEGGLSGFPKRNESDCDSFDTGHSSNSISAGLGYVLSLIHI